MGLMFGKAGSAEDKYAMGHFMATRPMTSADMSRTMLKAAGRSVLLGWGLWATAFLALYAILLIVHVNPRPELPRQVGWWYFPVTLLGTWVALTLSATISQAGRPALLASLICSTSLIPLSKMYCFRTTICRMRRGSSSHNGSRQQSA